MRRSNQGIVRAYLRVNADGATVREMENALGIPADSLRPALAAMPDVYIDRWAPARRGQFAAVWCVVEVPEHCPRPDAEVCA